MLMTYLTEEQFTLDSDLSRKMFQKKVNSDKRLSEGVNKFSNESLFTRKLLQNLYENFIYKENFEIEEKDSASFKFANRFLTGNTITSVVQKSNVSLPHSITEDRVIELAENISDNMTKMYVEDNKFEMIEIEESIRKAEEKEIKISENTLASKFPLYKEFKALTEVTKPEDGNVGQAIVAAMTDDQKHTLAIKINSFNKCLESLGIDVKSEKMKQLIKEEFYNSFVS